MSYVYRSKWHHVASWASFSWRWLACISASRSAENLEAKTKKHLCVLGPTMSFSHLCCCTGAQGHTDPQYNSRYVSLVSQKCSVWQCCSSPSRASHRHCQRKPPTPSATWAPGGPNCVGCRSRGNSGGITNNTRSRDIHAVVPSRSSGPVPPTTVRIHLPLDTSRLRRGFCCDVAPHGAPWWQLCDQWLHTQTAAEYRDKVQTTPFLRTQSTHSQRGSKLLGIVQLHTNHPLW